MTRPEIEIGVKPAPLCDVMSAEFEAESRALLALYRAAPIMRDALQAQESFLVDHMRETFGDESEWPETVFWDPLQTVRAALRACGKRACRFTFGDSPEFAGLTDESSWNEFLNVWVTPATHAAVIQYFADSSETTDELAQLQPGPDGLISYAYGYATEEA